MAIATNRVTATNDLDLKDRLVAINRVTKVTKGGRTFTFAAIVVVGNEYGSCQRSARSHRQGRRGC